MDDIYFYYYYHYDWPYYLVIDGLIVRRGPCLSGRVQGLT